MTGRGRPAPAVTLAVAAGGAAGALARYAVDVAAPASSGFPWPTLLVNLVGSFLLALLPGITLVRRSTLWTAALGPGLLGGFTTLSAYAEQSRALLADGRVVTAAAYVLLTLVGCVVAAVVGGRLVRPAAPGTDTPATADGVR